MSSGPAFSFVAPPWQHGGADGWRFLTLPEDPGEEIREISAGSPRPFGTVRATVTVGPATWSTSLFADRRLGSYVLPVKAKARQEAGLCVGDEVECQVGLID